MSMNLIISEYKNDDIMMIYPRFKIGITNSAEIHIQDRIVFEDTGIEVTVISVVHRWERPNSLRAPLTTVRGRIFEEMSEPKWAKLRELGFNDLVGSHD